LKYDIAVETGHFSSFFRRFSLSSRRSSISFGSGSSCGRGARSEAVMIDRRSFLTYAGLVPLIGPVPRLTSAADEVAAEKADYTLRIGTGLVELAPDHIVSTTLYNGQFPGPLLRFAEGQRTVVDIHNDTAHAGAGALARADDPQRRRRRFRGRFAVRAGARDAPDLVRAEALGLPALSRPDRWGPRVKSLASI
jgi:Multicopper oxidase